MTHQDTPRRLPAPAATAAAVFATSVIVVGYLSVPSVLNGGPSIALALVSVVIAGVSLTHMWRRRGRSVTSDRSDPLSHAELLTREFDLLLRNSNDIILLIEPEGRIVSANERAMSTYGYAREELEGLNIRSLRAPETAGDVAGQMKQVEQQGGMRFETVHRRKDGHTFPVETSSRVIEIDGKKYFQSIIRDITDRKRGEQRLKRLNECFLSFGSDPVRNINALVGLCGELLDATSALYNRLDGELLCSIGQWKTPADYQSEDKPEGHLCYDVIKGSREDVTVVRNLSATRYFVSDPNVKRYDLMTYVGKAVQFGEENIGSLCAVFQRDYIPSDDDEKFLGIIAGAIGVEENRRRKEEALRESEERYKRLVDLSPDAIAVHREGRFVFVNQAGLSLIGAKELKDIAGKPILDIVHPDFQKLVRGRAFQPQGKEHGQPFVEEKFIRFDGSLADVEVATGPIMFEGKPATLVVARDLEARKRAETELVRLRKAVESSGEIIFTTDTEGVITFVNPEFTNVYGYKSEEMVGKVTPRVLKSGVLDEANYRAFWDALVQKRVFKGELTNRTKDGRLITVEGSASPILGEQGSILGYLAIQRDVTARKGVEDALRKSEESYRGLFNNVVDAIYIQDKEGRFLDVNSGAVGMYGYSREFFVGKTPVDIAAPGMNDLVETRRALERAFHGEPQRFEWWGRRSNGEIFPKEVRLNRSVYFGQEVVVAFTQDITERKNAERALRDSEERYRVMFNSNPHPMWVYDLETLRFLAVNDAAVQHYGFGRDEFLTMTIAGIRVDGGHIEAGEAAPEEDRRDRPLARKHRRKNGTVIDVEVITHTLSFAGRRAQLVLATNVTERKRAEEAMKRSELRFRRVWESSMDGMRLLDGQGNYVMVNDSFCRIMGKTKDELIGKPFSAVYEPVPAEEEEEDLKTYRHRLSTGTFPTHQEVELPLHGGKRIQVDMSNSLLEIPNEPPLLLSIFRDITARRDAEQKLRESEEKFRTLSEQSPNMIYINKGGKVVYVNQRCVELMGFSKEEFYASTFDFLSIIAPEHTALVRKNYARHVAGEEIPPYEYTLVAKDGKRVVGLHTTRIINYEGSGAILGIVTDMTEIRVAEEELRKLHSAVEQSPSSIVITDVKGIIEYVNPKFTVITGYSIEEAIGQNPRILKSGHTPPDEYSKLWEAILSGKEWRGEFHNKKKNGEFFWEHASISPIRDASGTITHFLAVKQDITERKMLEQQLWQAQKMESVGTLASGIAHDFNNILGIILGYASLMNQKSLSSERATAYLSSVIKAAERGAGLVRQILTFARKSEFKLEKVDVNSIIGELATMLGETFPRTISLGLQLEKALPPLSIDRTQLHQALLNLCVNARDAMCDRGSIIVATKLIEGNALFPRFAAALGKSYVEISVSDSGSGMDEETKRRIFEPFFTTKDIGKGTGLGLSVVFGVVQEHQGFVDVESEPGRGSTFRVYLPVPEGALQSASESEAGGVEGPGGSETILVVEDEDLMLELVVTLLSQKGYRVLAAKDGEEAIKVHLEHKGEIDLVLSDIGLPRLDGWEACQRMKEADPGLIVFLASGYLDPVMKSEISKAGVREFIGKPYRPKEILEKVREALDAS